MQLEFEETPDYEGILQMFYNIMGNKGIENNGVLDWTEVEEPEEVAGIKCRYVPRAP